MNATVQEADSAARPRSRRALGLLKRAAMWLPVLALIILGWPVQLGGTTGYTIVAGHSMQPTYHAGDLLITRRKAHYRPGEIVVYRVPKGQPGTGYQVVHRLIGGSGAPGAPGWTTKGDNNPSADIWNPHDSDIRGPSY
jgi:signal peptidase I